MGKKKTNSEIQDAIVTAHKMKKKADWGATGPWKTLDKDWNYDTIAIHHSGNRGEKDPKAIEKLHKDKGYDDVGYHYMIHPDGTFYEGREIQFKGSHVSMQNTGKIGVLMMGDFDEQVLDLDDDDLTDSHLKCLKDLIKTLKRHFDIKTLGGHKEFFKKGKYSCPGNLIMDKMASLRTEFSLAAPQA